MNRLDIILHELGDYHRERAQRETESYVRAYPRYLNVIRETYVPTPLKEKAESIVANQTTAAKIDAAKNAEFMTPQLAALLADEKIDSPEKLSALIKFMYTALSGICDRGDGKLVESCKRYAGKNSELVTRIRQKLAENPNFKK